MERFTLRPSQEQGSWVVTDQTTGVSVTFVEHHFNDLQKADHGHLTPADFMEIARSLSAIGDWMYTNHQELI